MPQLSFFSPFSYFIKALEYIVALNYIFRLQAICYGGRIVTELEEEYHLEMQGLMKSGASPQGKKDKHISIFAENSCIRLEKSKLLL